MVAGIGPADAKGMIVGEAPGFEEEKRGEPFVGKSGTLLFGCLSILGIERGEVYVTNVVKEIPLDDDNRIRRPSGQEIAAWSVMLALEITNVAPVAILCLGRTAIDALMPEGAKVGERFGSYFAAWHPAYLLHRGLDTTAWVEQQLKPWADEVYGAPA